MSEDQQKPTPMFAVVELFGHARIAGAVSEQTFGGCNLVRVDVPEITFREKDYRAAYDDAAGGYPSVERTIAAHTRSFGTGAIYSINWCDEQTAKAAAAAIQHEPLKPYSPREAVETLRATPRLAGPSSED